MLLSLCLSFGMTENYYVFVEQPLCFSLLKVMLSQFKGESFSSALTFYPEEKVNVSCDRDLSL